MGGYIEFKYNFKGQISSPLFYVCLLIADGLYNVITMADSYFGSC